MRRSDAAGAYRPLADNKGSTLVELFIAGVLGVVIIGSALSVYRTQHKHLIVQDQVSDMQQGMRAGMHELATRIRMAGYNVPRGVACLVASDTNPDSITIIYDSGLIYDVTLSNEMPQPSAELACHGDVSPLQEGDWVFIWDWVARAGEFFQVTHVQVEPARLQHGTAPLLRCYPAGSTITRIDRFQYFVDVTTDPAHPALMFREGGQPPQIYSDNIADLQFRYVLSSGVTVDVPPSSTMVREVIIEIAARTDRADADLGGTYRTRNLQTRVRVRNLATN